MGVGLTNSKILTESLGGSIQIESAESEYTRVTFRVRVGVDPNQVPSLEIDRIDLKGSQNRDIYMSFISKD